MPLVEAIPNIEICPSKSKLEVTAHQSIDNACVKTISLDFSDHLCFLERVSLLKKNERAMERSPSVFLLILTWNDKASVLECLESILNIDYDNLRVVVIDNGSEDGTQEALKSVYGDRIKLIENGKNLRFSRGNNAGIEYALREKADYLMLLNNDIVVDPKMVRALVNVAEGDPSIGILGPKIYYYEPKDQLWFAGGSVSMFTGLCKHIGIRETDNGQYDEIKECDYVTGCALLIKRKVVEEIGLLDPVYLAYYEDSDWCWRARLAGYRSVYVPEGKLWHKISISTGGQFTWYKIRNRIRSSFIFFLRYASFYHFLTIPLFFVYDAIRVLILVMAGQIRDTKKK